MKRYLIIACLILLANFSNGQNDEKFTTDLNVLKEYFSIPGISAIVARDNEVIYETYLGYSDIENKIVNDASTAYPIASITKLYSSVLIMKLVEQGKLSLEDPISMFIPDVKLEDQIKVKHLLSHTSQGEVGNQFFYSNRFSLLTHVIEIASGKTFKDYMQNEIFNVLGLENSFLLEDTSNLTTQGLKVAKPYFLEDGIMEGQIEFGYSSSAGIVSTPSDLLKFNRAIDQNVLISKESKEVMFNGISSHLPYAYGNFKQSINDVNLSWVYGQYDFYSSLLVKVPARKLTLILFANNNLMSDPARLIMGDLRSSLFALSFLNNFVFDESEKPILETIESVDVNNNKDELYRRKILAHALAESFMARFDPSKMDNSVRLIQKIMNQYPDYLEYADINLLHTFSFLKDVAFYMELGDFNTYDKHIIEIGHMLLDQNPNDPYVHTYLANFYNRKNNTEKTRYHYQSVINAKNFSPNWYTIEARNWLNQNP